jgi:hypothetical protein
MRNFILGFALGAFLFGSVATYASGVRIIGTGTAMGWDVVNEEGTIICSDPEVLPTREIECSD